MPPSPHVSIVIPVYNVAAYLPACLDSLAAQTFSSFEVIAVNDGSTDDSKKILSAFAATHSFARVLSQMHAGLAAARALGVAQARGKYITFLDGDDVLSPNYMEALWQTVQATGASLAVAPLIRFVRELPVPVCVAPLFETGTLSGKTRVTIFEDASAAMALCGKLFSRELAQKLAWGASSLHNGEDIAMAVQLISRVEKIAFSPNAHYFYRQRETSQSHSGDKRFIDLVQGFLQARIALKDNGMYADFSSGFEYIFRVAVCSFMEKYGISPEEENFLRTHRADLQVPPELFALRPFKFRVRQWLFEKSLKGYFSYSCLMHGLHRLMHRTQKASEVAAKIG